MSFLVLVLVEMYRHDRMPRMIDRQIRHPPLKHADLSFPPGYISFRYYPELHYVIFGSYFEVGCICLTNPGSR